MKRIHYDSKEAKLMTQWGVWILLLVGWGLITYVGFTEGLKIFCYLPRSIGGNGIYTVTCLRDIEGSRAQSVYGPIVIGSAFLALTLYILKIKWPK
jgi:hypothetical protein